MQCHYEARADMSIYHEVEGKWFLAHILANMVKKFTKWECMWVFTEEKYVSFFFLHKKKGEYFDLLAWNPVRKVRKTLVINIKIIFPSQEGGCECYSKYLKQTASNIFSASNMDQQVSPSYHTFWMVTQSYHSKVTPIGGLHAEKLDEAVLLYVFRIAFPGSHLVHDCKNRNMTFSSLYFPPICHLWGAKLDWKTKSQQSSRPNWDT